MALAMQQPACATPQEHIRCSACKVNVFPNERNSHYRSDWHRYNLKRKCVAMPPIPKHVFEEKLASIVSAGQQIEGISNKKRKKASNKNIQKNYDTLMNNDQWQHHLTASKQNIAPSSLLNYRCTLCSKTFKTHQQCSSHLNTKKHNNEFVKYHKDLRNKQEEEISVFQATNDGTEAEAELAPTMDDLVPLNELKPIKTIQNNPFITIKQVTIKNKKRGVHDNDNDDESKSNHLHENIEGPYIERRSIHINECLFCTHSCADRECAVLHMELEHGFFVPLPRRLTDLERLLSVAGDIIGKQYQCVWCWKIFKSVRGVQMHMRRQGHCKLQIEYSSNITYDNDEDGDRNTAVSIVNENDQSPFVTFFDFDKVIVDTDDEDMDANGRELVLRDKRHITEINECDELVRNDGTVIGHRGNAVIYRQKHMNLSKYKETQSEEQIIAQINYPERKLKLAEMERQKNIIAFEESGARQQGKGVKVKEHEAMNLQTRQHKVIYQNWVNLQKSKQLR